MCAGADSRAICGVVVSRSVRWARRRKNSCRGCRRLGCAACDVEDRVPVTPYSRVWAPADPLSDLAVKVRPLPLVHRDVAGERVEESDVLLGGVLLPPNVTSDL